MRRTRHLRLTLLAGAGVALTACARGDSAVVLPDLPACLGRFGPAALGPCKTAFETARDLHLDSAPAFIAPEACAAATRTACEPITLESAAAAPEAATPPPGEAPTPAPAEPPATVYIPVMAGVLVGPSLGDGTGGVLPVYGGPPPGACIGAPAPDCVPYPGAAFWFSGGILVGSSGPGHGGRFHGVTTTYAGRAALRGGGIAGRAGGFGRAAHGHGGHGG